MTGILAALISTTMVFAVQAQKKQGQQHLHKGFGDGFLIDPLELTDAQQKKVETLRNAERTKIEKIRKEMTPLRNQLRAQWEKETIDKNAVRSLKKKMHDLKGKIETARTQFRLGVYDVLTKEQRQKAASQRKAHHQGNPCPYKGTAKRPHGKKRGDGMGRGHGRGHGQGSGFTPGQGGGPRW